MSSKWHEKKAKLEAFNFEKQLQFSADDTTTQKVNFMSLSLIWHE